MKKKHNNYFISLLVILGFIALVYGYMDAYMTSDDEAEAEYLKDFLQMVDKSSCDFKTTEEAVEFNREYLESLISDAPTEKYRRIAQDRYDRFMAEERESELQNEVSAINSGCIEFKARPLSERIELMKPEN